jgi:hypothetical protein
MRARSWPDFGLDPGAQHHQGANLSGSAVPSSLRCLSRLLRPDLAAAALLFVLFTRLSDLPVLNRGPVSLTQLMVGLVFLLVVGRLVLRRGTRLETDRVLVAMLATGAPPPCRP